jgi:hypothetical protein
MEADMGQAKDEQQRAEDAWARAGNKCAVCAQSVPLSETESYFETGMCARCRNMMEGED